MVDGGIAIAEDCQTFFNAMRMNRAHRYIIFKLNDEKTSVEIDKLGERE